ncbi:MAG: hypothetical protein U0Q07_19310 [Acidimicrobiales bacterium]
MATGSADGVPGRSGHHDWALVGTRDAAERALVDPRGLVTPRPGGWSLDWWIGADDRWHLAGREAGVRQRLVGDAPVVETAMRVPSGDVLHRVCAVRAAADDGGGDFLVVEIENRSPVPVAVALAVVPANPLGPARVEQIRAVEVAGGIDPGGGPAGGGRRGIEVDGRLAVVLPREPARSVSRVAAEGGCLDVVVAGDAPAGPPPELVDPEGGAGVAVVFPLPHTAVLRVLLPLHLPSVRRGRGARRDPSLVARIPDALPSAEQVAKGWEAQSRRGLQAQLPDARLTATLDAARRWLLVTHAGADIVDGAGRRPAAALGVADLAPVVVALAEQGFADEATQVLASLDERQALDGSFAGDGRRLDANGAVLWAVGRHWSLHRDAALPELLVGPLAKAAQWLGKRRASRRHRRDPATVGLLPDGSAPAFAVGPDELDTRYRDDLWGVLGLREVVAALLAIDQPEVAATVAEGAASFAAALDAALAADADRHGQPGVALGPGRPLGRDAVGGLDALAAGALGPDHPALVGTVDGLVAAGAAAAAGGPVADPAGTAGHVRPALTAWLARVELALGRPEIAASRLRWLVDEASPVVTWPEVWSSATRHGAGGAGFDVATVAAVCSLGRDLLVREVAPAEPAVAALDLLSWVPADWYGQGLEVHGAPTALGTVSYAVRWHGERPALLWELDPHDAELAIRLRAPGLDPTWSTDRARGEALLAAPASGRAASDGQPTPPDPGGSFS